MTMQCYRILIAERNPNVREFLRREFSGQGYAVHLVRDAGELRGMLRSDLPLDLVVLDPEIPNPLGTDLLVEVNRFRPELPIILHTFSADEQSSSSHSGQVTTYVEKNGNPERLSVAVGRVLEKRRILVGGRP
jgi:DNA-binding NtrC family response regulator